MKHELPQNEVASNSPAVAGKPRVGRQVARPGDPDSRAPASEAGGACDPLSPSGTREGILAALGDGESFVSGEALAERLGVSRAAVWKHVTALKRRGYEIVGVRSRGYRLISRPDPLDDESLWRAVRARSASLGSAANGGREGAAAEIPGDTGIGAGDNPGNGVGRGVKPGAGLAAAFVCKQVTASTNSDALALGRQGAPEGTVVIAEEQSSGRGRLGRSWESVRGVNLYMSLLLRPPLLPAQAPQLSLVAGLAVASAIEELGLAPRIKWPNDVVLGGRKVAGILTEIEAEADRVAFVVVGMGVNLNSRPEQFSDSIRDIATSVLIETGQRVDRSAFAASLLAHLEAYYRRFLDGGFRSVSDDWEQRSMLSGRRISVSGAGAGLRGVCVGIDGDGALLLKEDGETGVEPPAQGSGQAREQASGRLSGQAAGHARPQPASRLRRILAGDVSIEGAYGRETS